MKDTQENSNRSRTPSETPTGGVSKARPALDEAHIRVRPDGRQLVIDRGNRSENVDSDDRGHGGHDGEGTPAAPVAESTITGFSEDSRRRLRKRLHAMRRDASGLFLTLTYHEKRPTPEVAKGHLEAFFKRLERQFPDISVVWKLEPQDRGMPHFHLMVYGVDFIPVQWLSSIWHDVTGEDSEAHGKSGVDLEPFVNEDGKLQGYMAKYMAETYDQWPGVQPGDPWAETGRWWGCKGQDRLPWASWDDAAVYLNEGDAIQLIRDLLDKWEVDVPSGVVPESLTITTRGDPTERLDALLDRL